jgi:DNA-binding MarR family transcriptional regulator
MGFQIDPKIPAGADLATEAWGLLIPLVYPPRFLEIARKLGVTAPILGTMRLLDEPRTMGQMAELLRCDPSNVTGLVDALEAKDLAERRPSEVDRRVKVVVLTPKGSKLRARTMAEMRKPPPWLHGLSNADQRRLRDVLRRAQQEGG